MTALDGVVRCRWPLLFISIVFADQLTKALKPWMSLDPDTGPWVPAMVRHPFRNADTRNLVNVVAALLLIALGAFVARRVRSTV
jgi:hypothetical protein